MAWFDCTGGNGSGPAPTPTYESYIYNLGNQGIAFNTGHIHTANTKVVFKAEIDSWVGQWGQVFGARNGSYRANAFTFFGRANASKYMFTRSGNESAGATVESDAATSPWNLVPCIFTAEGQSISWYRETDPLTVRTLTSSGTVDAGIAPLAIFGCNNANTANGWALGDIIYGLKLYWFEIYESGVLVHRFVPAYDNNQYCLYDEVDHVYNYDVVRSGANVRGYIAS